MLHDPSYARRWMAKQQWYRQNGILPYEEGGGPAGTLLVTRDELSGGIDSAKIVALLNDVFGV